MRNIYIIAHVFLYTHIVALTSSEFIAKSKAGRRAASQSSSFMLSYICHSFPDIQQVVF